MLLFRLLTRRAALYGAAAIFTLNAGLQAADAAAPSPIEITAELDRARLLAGESQKAYLRIGITSATRPAARRAPMNIALVVDRSGSMSAEARMENARRAAQMAVDRLGRDDVLSVISYDDRVEIDVPATKVTDPRWVKERIARLTPRGSTAIHAGLLAGANELRKFKSRDRVNRIILLSDGLANVGPSRPQDFVSLGRELASEGITVSTIGLGNAYNEDLMAGLARAADGNHVFVQESADLASFISREFNDTLNIVGQQAEVTTTFRNGIRPIRALGRDVMIRDGRLVYKVGALFSGAEQVLLAELDVSVAAADGAGPVARIEVTYLDPADGKSRSLHASVDTPFTFDRASYEGSVNSGVMRDVTTLVSREAREEAIRLRDAGRHEDARSKFETNAAYVREQQGKLSGARDYAPLETELNASVSGAATATQSGEAWSRTRKSQQMDNFYTGASKRF